MLTTSTYSDTTGRRLYAAAAEACRPAGWCAYDNGRLADGEKHFTASLRAAATEGHATLGASTLAFWANLRYSGGDPYGALGPVERALDNQYKITSGRVVAMLHTRAARAYSKADEPTAAYRAIDAAFAAYDRAGPPSTICLRCSMYWMTHGEVHEVAASCALPLSEPARALEHFDAALRHEDPYGTRTEARGAGIYLARQAEAHLALGDIDAAVAAAERAVEQLEGADSARGTSALTDLRGRLAAHRTALPVAGFLDLDAQPQVALVAMDTTPSLDYSTWAAIAPLDKVAAPGRPGVAAHLRGRPEYGRTVLWAQALANPRAVMLCPEWFWWHAAPNQDHEEVKEIEESRPADSPVREGRSGAVQVLADALRVLVEAVGLVALLRLVRVPEHEDGDQPGHHDREERRHQGGDGLAPADASPPGRHQRGDAQDQADHGERAADEDDRGTQADDAQRHGGRGQAVLRRCQARPHSVRRRPSPYGSVLSGHRVVQRRLDSLGVHQPVLPSRQLVRP
ncbi:hypothetical protein [Streptomyces telluris]|uniref:Tetratricopeptide repeat protein n=1 Tax=Streptomyces telluris TaxID=2720021 RepID=A0A9X2LH65_9ACTN|nr:hypothetical protein [Streptomyces telluris]MCQ8769820.1 hypothetical protein [Streptomyces telluris]NJP77573.1 hypothetical protein [Streptomyces telluris]